MTSKLIIFDLDDTLIDTSNQLRSETVWEDIKGLGLLPGVKEFLVNFPARKFLVTKEGMKGLQDEKIKMLGIERLFEKIKVCYSNEEKEACFAEIKSQNKDSEIWVVGDRIDSDIRYGNKVGLKTVLLRRGKYKDLKARDELEIPDYEIQSFEELKNLLECKQ